MNHILAILSIGQSDCRRRALLGRALHFEGRHKHPKVESYSLHVVPFPVSKLDSGLPPPCQSDRLGDIKHRGGIWGPPERIWVKTPVQHWSQRESSRLRGEVLCRDEGLTQTQESINVVNPVISHATKQQIGGHITSPQIGLNIVKNKTPLGIV